MMAGATRTTPSTPSGLCTNELATPAAPREWPTSTTGGRDARCVDVVSLILPPVATQAIVGPGSGWRKGPLARTERPLAFHYIHPPHKTNISFDSQPPAPLRQLSPLGQGSLRITATGRANIDRRGAALCQWIGGSAALWTGPPWFESHLTCLACSQWQGRPQRWLRLWTGHQLPGNGRCPHFSAGCTRSRCLRAPSGRNRACHAPARSRLFHLPAAAELASMTTGWPRSRDTGRSQRLLQWRPRRWWVVTVHALPRRH